MAPLLSVLHAPTPLTLKHSGLKPLNYNYSFEASHIKALHYQMQWDFLDINVMVLQNDLKAILCMQN